MTKEKPLSEKDIRDIKKINRKSHSVRHIFLYKDVASAVERLKEEIIEPYGHVNKKKIDKIMGSFNHSPQGLTSKKVILNSDLNLTAPEDTQICECGMLVKGTTKKHVDSNMEKHKNSKKHKELMEAKEEGNN